MDLTDEADVRRLLDVIEQEIVPLTRAGVAAGNKIFGAAIVRRADLSTVVAETNNETENPLWHGEIHAIKRFFELPAEDRPDPADCLLLGDSGAAQPGENSARRVLLHPAAPPPEPAPGHAALEHAFDGMEIEL